jgi:hypothetical protein
MELVSLNLYCRKLFNDSINFIQIIFYLFEPIIGQTKVPKTRMLYYFKWR